MRVFIKSEIYKIVFSQDFQMMICMTFKWKLFIYFTLTVLLFHISKQKKWYFMLCESLKDLLSKRNLQDNNISVNWHIYKPVFLCRCNCVCINFLENLHGYYKKYSKKIQSDYNDAYQQRCIEKLLPYRVYMLELYNNWHYSHCAHKKKKKIVTHCPFFWRLFHSLKKTFEFEEDILNEESGEYRLRNKDELPVVNHYFDFLISIKDREVDKFLSFKLWDWV